MFLNVFFTLCYKFIEQGQTCIKVKGFRVSSSSDLYVDNQDFGGAIVYNVGTWNESNIQPGYTIIADTSPEKLQECRDEIRQNDPGADPEGQVHGCVVWKKFN